MRFPLFFMCVNLGVDIGHFDVIFLQLLQNGWIMEVFGWIIERNGWIIERNGRISERNGWISERNVRISERNVRIIERNGRIHSSCTEANACSWCP